MAVFIDWLANIIIIIGLIFMGIGVYGTFRFNDFFNRILITAKIDTVGFITILIGVIVKTGLSFFTLKILLVIILFLVTNPIATHATLRSADLSNYRIKGRREENLK